MKTQRNTFLLSSLALVAGLVVTASATAQAPARKSNAPLASATKLPRLGLGYFAPELALASAGEAFRFTQALASHLAMALGTPVDGYAYKRSSDFERDVRRGKLHIALLGPFYIAGSGRVGAVLAVSRLAKSTPKWTVMASPSRASKAPSSAGGPRLKDLAGAVLQIPSMGRLSVAAVQHALFAGQVDPRKYFRVRRAPTLMSAVAAVRVGRADAVFAPETTSGLISVIGAITVPPPALVRVGQIGPAQLATARSAAISFNEALSDSYRGFEPDDGQRYAQLRARCVPRIFKMALLPIPGRHLDIRSVLSPERLVPPLLAIEGALWID